MVHVAAGRVRVRWPQACSEAGPDVRHLLASIAGARDVRASALTQNVLVRFDERMTTPERVLADIRRIAARLASSEGRSGRRETTQVPVSVAQPRQGAPAEPRGVKEPVTLELVESGARAAGALAGLCLVLARGRRAGPLPAARTASAIASSLMLLEGYSELRARSDRLLGSRGRAPLLAGAGVAAHILSGSPLGLAIAALVSSRQLLESFERRRALRGYRHRANVVPLADSSRSAVRLEEGDRLLASGLILDGEGSSVDGDGLLRPVGPGSDLEPGARLFGGPFLVELRPGAPPVRRSETPSADSGTQLPPWRETAALAAAAITFLTTRSISRGVGALILLSSRAEFLGEEAAGAWANLRVLRSGALPLHGGVNIRLPDLVLFDRPRTISDGLEVAGVDVRQAQLAPWEAIDLALAVATLAGSPWGPIRRPSRLLEEGEGRFDGYGASAQIEGRTYTLTPYGADGGRLDGGLRLLLGMDGDTLAVVRLQPRLAAEATELAALCRRLGVELVLSHEGTVTSATRSLAGTMGLTLSGGSPGGIVRRALGQGRRVALVTDSGEDAEALALADLTIGLAAGLDERFAPRVDVLVPDLATCAALLEVGARRDRAVREARLVSSTANVVGAGWIAVGAPQHRLAGALPNLATLAVLLVAWFRLRGGSPPGSTVVALVDPRPEKWGRRATSDVLRTLATSERGLSRQAAAARARPRVQERHRHAFVSALQAQVRSPLTGILVAGAALSLATSALADVVLIFGVIGLNAVLGAFQERQAGAAAEALEQMGQVVASVLRDGRRVRVPASELVTGDVLLLASGERVGADARVLFSRGLEVDQASLTGESFPVAKRAEGGSPEARVVLDGTDVTVGSGRAVAFAVGRDTRFGVTAAALESTAEEASALDRRLHGMLLEVLPVVLGGGALVVLAGLLWRRPLAAQLALGAGTAIAAVPEGLPLLSSLGEAAVARRLARRRAFVRRLSAVESLGRVDVACVDKTGTLTENRLRLHVVVGPTGSRAEPESLTRPLGEILRCAALASPSPVSSVATAHGTDVAVLEGARLAGLAADLGDIRTQEVPFDAARGFQATLVDGRACLKGSPEALVWCCTRVRLGEGDERLEDAGRVELLDLARELAGEGLRVLMVAEGPPGTSLVDPDELVALGFLGIRDTVRPEAAEAVRHCRQAGIEVIVLTGDHPATARAIGREIGLLDGGGVLTGPEIEDLPDEELASALGGTSVVARITPLEKLRIVEALRRRGHIVAMTGDGVNDAPALRLADVGIAMGPSGTEVARQAADLVLAEDDLTLLAEALIEGRTFWGNLRVALAMLLGGNLGEVAFIVTLACAGFAAPLTARQVLAVNLVSDVLPAISLVVQAPKRRDLSRLSREGDATLGTRLRREIFVRAVSTATPALAAYSLARAVLGPQRAQSVGFASIVFTQLTQTLDAGREDNRVSLATTAAVAGSTALLAAALHLRPLQAFLRLTTPGVLGWALIAAAGAAAPAVSRVLAQNGPPPGLIALPAPAHGAAV